MGNTISARAIGDSISFNANTYRATPIEESNIVPCLSCDLNKFDCSGVACDNSEYIFKLYNKK
jgi:hypothetical protein